MTRGGAGGERLDDVHRLAAVQRHVHARWPAVLELHRQRWRRPDRRLRSRVHRPVDNDEGSFATGIPGDNKDANKQDCFFDGNSGGGDDGCNQHVCCLFGATTKAECQTDLVGIVNNPMSRATSTTSPNASRRSAARRCRRSARRLRRDHAARLRLLRLLHGVRPGRRRATTSRSTRSCRRTARRTTWPIRPRASAARRPRRAAAASAAAPPACCARARTRMTSRPSCRHDHVPGEPADVPDRQWLPGSDVLLSTAAASA